MNTEQMGSRKALRISVFVLIAVVATAAGYALDRQRSTVVETERVLRWARQISTQVDSLALRAREKGEDDPYGWSVGHLTLGAEPRFVKIARLPEDTARNLPTEEIFELNRSKGVFEMTKVLDPSKGEAVRVWIDTGYSGYLGTKFRFTNDLAVAATFVGYMVFMALGTVVLRKRRDLIDRAALQATLDEPLAKSKVVRLDNFAPATQSADLAPVALSGDLAVVAASAQKLSGPEVEHTASPKKVPNAAEFATAGLDLGPETGVTPAPELQSPELGRAASPATRAEPAADTPVASVAPTPPPVAKDTRYEELLLSTSGWNRRAQGGLTQLAIGVRDLLSFAAQISKNAGTSRERAAALQASMKQGFEELQMSRSALKTAARLSSQSDALFKKAQTPENLRMIETALKRIKELCSQGESTVQKIEASLEPWCTEAQSTIAAIDTSVEATKALSPAITTTRGALGQFSKEFRELESFFPGNDPASESTDEPKGSIWARENAVIGVNEVPGHQEPPAPRRRKSRGKAA